MHSMQGQRDFRQFRSERRPTVELDQGQVVADVDAVEALRELGLDSVDGAMGFEKGRLVRDAGTRRTWRVESSAGVWYVKVHKEDGSRLSLRSLFRAQSSPARAEWNAITSLGQRSFDRPEPVAMGESSVAFGTPPCSFVITREVPGPSLAELLEGGWPELDGSGDLHARERILKDVAGMIRRFHSAGFFHRDLYLAHLIVTPDPRWGRPYFIDLARVQQHFPPRHRWLVKDLAALESSCPASVSRTDKMRFLLRYLCKARLDPLAKRWIREVLAKSARIRAHTPKYA